MPIIRENHYSQNTANVFPAVSKMVRDLGQAVSKVVKGQTYAIYCVEEALFEAFAVKQSDYKGPKASFLMTGVPGVGKTQMVEEVAKVLKLPYLRVNMSSYSDKEEGVFNFKGINESYKASRAGDVTKFVSENPNGLILFDEVDKAHQNVLNLLYQVLEGGELEDGHLRKKISFKNNVIFMTTNVGAELFQDIDRYNYATLPESKILNSLGKEINPITNAPCFNAALVSRFAKGKIVPFNRLNGQILCEIARSKAEEVFDRFDRRYPDVELVCDAQSLAKSLLLSKGLRADARNLTGEVEHFFGTHLFDAMQKYEENNQDFSRLKKVEFTFNFADGEDRVKNIFEEAVRYKAAVYCSEEEKEAFESYEGLDVDFVTFDERVTSLHYDCAIVSVDLMRNENGLQYFRKVKKQDDLPVHVFSLQESADEIDMKTYYCEGAESAFLPKERQPLHVWLDEIAKEIHFSKLSSDLGRSNLVLRYDTACSYEIQDDVATLKIKTFNYRLERAIHADDEGNLVGDHEIPDVKFKDVKGLDSTVLEMQDMIKFIKNSKEYIRHGIKIPRGLLLDGGPGTGKTLLAKAVAGESGMPIIQRNAADYILPALGATQQAIRKDFALARKYAPSILFIDEVDAIAKKRGRFNASENTETGLNAFLSEMDGFLRDDKKPVFVIAATNFAPNDDVNGLDPAFVRRFDRRIKVNLPDSKSRLEILQYYLGKHSVTMPVLKLMNLVERSPGKSPAELELIVEYAVRQAFGRSLEVSDLEEAFETISHGDKKKWDAATVRKTSYHEAGHALVAWLTGNTPAYVTNISRGAHGGYMQYESDEDKMDYTRQEILDKICVSFAGRAAEWLTYGANGITTGAGADLQQARKLAYALVNDYAMETDFLLGISDVQSEETKRLFDTKVNDILKEQSVRANALVSEYKTALETLTEKLIAENSLDAKCIDELLSPMIERQKQANATEEVAG